LSATNEHRKLALSSAEGNPADGNIWSGTPRHLMIALAKYGFEIAPVFPQLSRWEKRACNWWHRGTRRRGSLERVGLQRKMYGLKVDRAVMRLGCSAVLHTGTLDLPGSTTDVRRFLFCDSTWRTYRRYEPDLETLPARTLKLADTLEHKAYHQITHFFPIGQHVKNDLMQLYNIPPSRITVVGSGRGQMPPLRGTKDFRDGLILFAAKNRFREKGGLLIVKAFKLAQQKRRDLQLVVVGGEAYRHEIGFVENVRLTASLPRDELQGLFHCASLFAMPAPNEPWGLVYLEALASQTPILGLKRNAFPELSGDGRHGFMVAESTPEAVAEGLLDALSDVDRLRAFGLAGQQFCLENYSWEKTGEQIARVIQTS
jgi:glycosyltransferase involved in cell wall biosynthesis